MSLAWMRRHLDAVPLMPELYPFQRVGATFLAERRVGILADDKGLGKTVQAIVAADRVGARRIITVCPAIARESWAREWSAWRMTPRSIQIVRSAADARHFSGDVVIVSYGARPAQKRSTVGTA